MTRMVHIFWVLVTIASHLPLSVDACSKFARSDPPLDTSTIYEDVCIYAFSEDKQYAVAEALCSGEETRLINYESESKQTGVYALLGTEYTNHWTGLKKLDDHWQWWDVTTGTGTPMTSSRWEGGSGGQVAYTQTTNMAGFLKSAILTMSFRVVCEDSSGSPATTMETTTMTMARTTTTTTVTTTTALPGPAASAGCTRDSYENSDSTRQIDFTRQNTLMNAQHKRTLSSDSLTHCGSLCLRDGDCCYFKRDSSTGDCLLYTFSEGDEVACSFDESCYVSL